MDEKSVLNLISQAVRHIFREYGSGWNERDEKEVSDRVAEAAWNSLILCMRELLSDGQPVVFEEFGRFQLTDSKWVFEPADSLLEAGAMGLDRDKGNQLIATHALFYLSQAASLINRIPDDVILSDKSSEISLKEEILKNHILDLEDLEYRKLLRQKLSAIFDVIANLKVRLVQSKIHEREFQEMGGTLYREVSNNYGGAVLVERNHRKEEDVNIDLRSLIRKKFEEDSKK